MDRKPTIDDVAARSGVGRTTVSRVLNDGPNVSLKVRERVMAAVVDLGFQVNAQARALAGGRRREIVLICATRVDREPNSYYHSALEMGALKVCSSLGLDLVTHSVDERAHDRARRIVALTSSEHCIGVVLTPPFCDDAEVGARLEEQGVVTSRVSPSCISLSAWDVGIDEEAAGYAITQHLLSLGHRRFGFLKGLEEHLAAEQRYDGTIRALAEADLASDAIAALRGDFTFKSGVDLLPDLLATSPMPTAIICANDDMAVGALFAAHRAGLIIPEDLSIASFDDTPVSALVWPPLTTVHQPIRELAGRAVEMVIAGQRGSRPSASIEYLPFRIVLRQSTARAPTNVVEEVRGARTAEEEATGSSGHSG